MYQDFQRASKSLAAAIATAYAVAKHMLFAYSDFTIKTTSLDT